MVISFLKSLASWWCHFEDENVFWMFLSDAYFLMNRQRIPHKKESPSDSQGVQKCNLPSSALSPLILVIESIVSRLVVLPTAKTRLLWTPTEVMKSSRQALLFEDTQFFVNKENVKEFYFVNQDNETITIGLILDPSHLIIALFSKWLSRH